MKFSQSNSSNGFGGSCLSCELRSESMMLKTALRVGIIILLSQCSINIHSEWTYLHKNIRAPTG
ncbi:uncharacterized protein METZ01_LOCUS384553, partial [marine metagenome]